MKEYKVGERFYHDGVLLEVVESDYSYDWIIDCNKCALDTETCGGTGKMRCASDDREDETPIYFKQVKQDCNCANYKPKRTETRVKKPEALLKALLDGGWKPTIEIDGIFFYKIGEVGLASTMWCNCGNIPSNQYKWHPSWLEEVEV